MPDIALYQPDIPQNTGTLLRLAACLDVTVHLIEPAGFPLSDHALKRAGMDYIERAKLQRHMDWESFRAWQLAEKRRLILMSTKATRSYTQFPFKKDDIILMGRESSGVPEEVHEIADARLLIPMKNGMRSLNMAVSTGMVLGEALRQTGCF
ncbi:tRNA (cytidine(34)-2'-O)-methyltransferase [Pseudovibrio sp. Tun.PSC04-5.I4]|uniref:tRNA (cytidine(34)-2'-O)-methyltransferase n=1 Tax=Pseudovibrio sp. Tun.PSC04-5.I4 TaxID=1798213 RepID=UPI000883313C|nr:tRNA (cytidine(34)-2'-O)-methyltransferase [Pseudovibrio sp. Tun.PSC04-5.I4]SDR34122.1 tRNA (cytidine/uridine-2'-O-)-methyltransferase [Pseudovibrio sp. Tun.PSC04-5.I4]